MTPEIGARPHSPLHSPRADGGQRKRSSTRELYTGFLDAQIEPKWGTLRLDQVKTVLVEKWLRSLGLAPATKAKIRKITSALFAHAIRHDMIGSNPIKGVRCSAKRQREPDVLSPAEFSALLDQLPERERVMVLLAGTTGLRRSELIALTWRDVDFAGQQIMINKSCVQSQIGETKTLASAKPVPLHPVLADELGAWRRTTFFKEEREFLFPSLRKNGECLIWPDTFIQR